MTIDEKLDQIDQKVDMLCLDSALIKKDLEHHIKRTDLLEEKVEVIKDIRAIFKALKWTSGVAAAIIVLVKAIDYLGR